jgi:pimeloyl-ACP methyl ester carboxylesterase
MIIYLHGFASSIHSGKAAFLRERLRERGLDLVTPDLNLPDFSTLTVTRMLEQTHALLAQSKEPATLIGSSLGGFVAVNAAVKWPDRVKGLVLMAPALDFSEASLSGPGGTKIQDWKRDGQLMVFHYAYGRMLPIRYDLYEDARRYDAMTAPLSMPVLVFQGKQDAAVNPRVVESWARDRPNVELHLLDDDHQLTASLPFMWEQLRTFLARD